MMRKWLCFCALVQFAAAVPVGAVGPRSAHYSFDYVSTATSGSVIEVGPYSVTSQVITKGLATQFASSGSGRYDVSPLVGTTGSTEVSSVPDWSLY